jgi:hypothetical protein
MTEETGVDRWEMKLTILSHKGYEKVNKSTNMNRTKNYTSPQLNYWIQKKITASNSVGNGGPVLGQGVVITLGL